MSLRNYLQFVVACVAVICATIFFILTWKYGFDPRAITISDVSVLLSWIIQRVSTVTASSVFLIESFYFDKPGFGFYGASEVMLSNIAKIFGHQVSFFPFASLGQYNFSLFYIGDNEDLAGLSPGVLGGALFFLPWYLAAINSGVLVFAILSVIASTWGRYLRTCSFLVQLVFFYFFIHFLLLNPYAWMSILDPGLIKFVVFFSAPVLFDILNRIRFFAPRSISLSVR